MIVLVFGPALLLVLISLNKCEHKFTELPVYGDIGEYEFTTSDGRIISNQTQKGKVTLFTTIQTTCPQNCAVDIPKINILLYQHYRKNRKKLGHIEFVSIVTDENGNPSNKTDEMVFMLNDIIQGFDETIWNIVAGDPKQIYDIESNNVNLFTQTNDSAFAQKPFLETMFIVDKENQLRLARRGNIEGMIRDFKEHVALLQKQYDKAAYQEKKENELRNK